MRVTDSARTRILTIKSNTYLHPNHVYTSASSSRTCTLRVASSACTHTLVIVRAGNCIFVQ